MKHYKKNRCKSVGERSSSIEPLQIHLITARRGMTTGYNYLAYKFKYLKEFPPGIRKTLYESR